MNLTVIVALPEATPVTVTVLFVLAAISPEPACVTVAFPVALLDTVNLPATVACSLNVTVFPATVVPLVALHVIVGVAFPILQLILTSSVVLSLHLYSLDNDAVTS